jgi:hypothetical protein
MPNYPNDEVEREVRSRVNGATEELIRKCNSELRELAASKYAPGPGMGSGPYEQMRVQVSISFYEALFQQIVDTWVDVLTRQSGRISASDVSHVSQELEARASIAPTHIRQALASRGTSVHVLPPGAMKALEDGARQKMNELVAKHRRELQTRLYNQDHPHPREVQPTPNINITKINSDNVNSTVMSGQANQIGAVTVRKGWWETWWGVVATSVIAGLILWGITGYLERREKTEKGNPADAAASARKAVSKESQAASDAAKSTAVGNAKSENSPSEDFLPPEATPAYLRSLGNGVSSIQAEHNLEPYIGKWMKWRGEVSDVWSNNLGNGGTVVVFVEPPADPKKPDSTKLIECFFDSNWTDQVRLLPVGKVITVKGTLNKLDRLTTILSHCQILSDI